MFCPSTRVEGGFFIRVFVFHPEATFATQHRERLYSVFTCSVFMVSLCFHCYASEVVDGFFYPLSSRIYIFDLYEYKVKIN